MVLSEDSIWGWMILKPFLKTWNIPHALIQYLAPKKLGCLFFFLVLNVFLLLKSLAMVNKITCNYVTEHYYLETYLVGRVKSGRFGL